MANSKKEIEKKIIEETKKFLTKKGVKNIKQIKSKKGFEIKGDVPKNSPLIKKSLSHSNSKFRSKPI